MIDSVIVSHSHNTVTDTSILCVGKKRPNQTVEVINAFQGPEADRLWTELTTKKEKDNAKESS